MFFIYILYSDSSDKYYLGYSSDPLRRLKEHNTKPFNTYTSKHRPWKLAANFKCSENETDAIRIEKFIKKQKSRKLLQMLCDPSFIPDEHLAQLLKVPPMRESPAPAGLIGGSQVQVGEEEQTWKGFH